jgi:hypothetical protein
MILIKKEKSKTIFYNSSITRNDGAPKILMITVSHYGFSLWQGKGNLECSPSGEPFYDI